MKQLTIRLPVSDLTALDQRFGKERGVRSEFIRSVIGLYMEDKTRFSKAIQDIMTGITSPITEVDKKARASLLVQDDLIDEFRETVGRTGLTLESFMSIALHAELEKERVNKL